MSDLKLHARARICVFDARGMLRAFAIGLTLFLEGAARGQTNVFPASGNVGIGTSNPTQKLHVTGVVRAGALSMCPAENDDCLTISGFTAPYNYIDFASGRDPAGNRKDLRITTGSYPNWNGDQIMLKASGITYFNAGNVGIGTTAPQFPLSVNGTVQAKEVRVETGWADYVFDRG